MDRRSWPWKKKHSDKTSTTPDSILATLASATSEGDQDNSKKVKYVQIPLESYTHLMDLEDEVKTLNDQVNVLNENLSSAQSEITTKENHVKQHTKVAEDAVAGWEKAEAEALALKDELESVTLLKLAAEDRASHLDGALKECMKQIRNVKEEHEKKLQENFLTKTKQIEKIKLEFEAQLEDLDQELHRSAAENAALSRSLHDRSAMLMKINEEKSQAEADIELLKTNIESGEREINSLKYEVHIVSKELEIRNEERNMSMKSAEVANKNHLESVKKIAKLETECQRLRGLVRKKLPGPAALAQMKQEVEYLGRDGGENRFRRSPVKNFNPHLSLLSEVSLDSVQQCHKENEFLTARLLSTEEETKMLKEALATRNSELQDSRNMFAKAASKLREMEEELQVLNQHKISRKLSIETITEISPSQNASNPPSLTSISEDEIDEEGSSGEGWAAEFKKEKCVGNGTNKVDNQNHVELMDDFLEMERLACSSTEINDAISVPENGDQNTSIEISHPGNLFVEQQLDSDAKSTISNHVSMKELQSKISMLFKPESKDADVAEVLEGIKLVVQDITLPPCSALCTLNGELSAEATNNHQIGICLNDDRKLDDTTELLLEQDLSSAVSQINDFVVSMGKEAMTIHDVSCGGHDFTQDIGEFSESVSKVLCKKMSLVEFLLGLAHVLAKVGDLSISVLGYKGIGREINSSDCVDKVTLLENNITRSTSDTEGGLSPASMSDGTLCKCLSDLDALKSEKDNMAMELARYTENLDLAKVHLEETEKLVMELKSQLVSSEKSNSLAETQLKCMAESYRSLENRAQALETEVNLLRTELEAVKNELKEEKMDHEDTKVKCKDLEEQIQRTENSSICALPSAGDTHNKFKQEKNIADATEKLAECQETILLLGRQLKAMRPSVELTGSMPYIEKHQMNEDLMEDGDHTEVENIVSPHRILSTEGCESPMNPSYTEANLLLRSPINSKHPPHQHSKTSSSSSPGLTPEKNSRGFSRFFSSKSKNG
ncbi:hypothetical protein C5167_020466 [Papaver somniferum]|uniref:Filament-like plant protein 4 n=1 Tax=Papaver somniferum TaxID=3469 RepID=A0A4Y7IWE6_PAPSO|nr:filament-like plant protein 4 [Papaver somniferum]RZC52042.1 hypothetical protein C5167_020466 [Papaver somniferum]